MPIGDAGELKERSLSNYDWKCGKEYREIRYELCDGVAKISINRPERRNAFTPLTVMEMYDAFSEARDDASVGVILLTGVNHGGRHEDEAFCSGGDQKKRGNGGYVGEDNIPRLNVLDLQRLIRVVPKPVIAMVNGYAIGGGHVPVSYTHLATAIYNDSQRRWTGAAAYRSYSFRRADKQETSRPYP